MVFKYLQKVFTFTFAVFAYVGFAFANAPENAEEADNTLPPNARGIQIEALAPSVTFASTDNAQPDPTVARPEVTSTDGKRACIALPGRTADLFLSGETSKFDDQFQAQLKSDPEEILVTLASPQAPDTLPSSLQPWLSEIETTGGAITLAPIQCVKTRGVFSWMKKQIMLLFGIEPKNTYLAMKDYDATLYYDEQEELVRQILFARRTTAP